MLKRIHDKRNGLKKTENSKERWGNKIRGEDYILRMRESYKRFVKMWIRFANP